MALLTAAALILGYLDSLIPLVPSIPGIKLGLSNLVLLYAVFYMRPGETLILMLLKVGLSSLLFGNAVGALYALAGGILSTAAMLLLHRIPQISVIPISTVGGILHIIGQCVIGSILISFKPVLFYAPWLLISGTATGLLLGLAARAAFYGIERYERRNGA
jgi:heptaprenyl diphosphate synthase